jgi:catechol 2,3-dioxygenase-like lactoylglutathione lyase family enzyme
MHGLADENPISEDNFDRYAERVQTPGIEIRRNRTPVEGEGRSLYFYDYDNHLLELHTERLISG